MLSSGITSKHNSLLLFSLEFAKLTFTYVVGVVDFRMGFEPVVIDTDDLIKKLEEMPPMDEASFKAKVNEIVSVYTKGKDTSKLRIVVKRRESEE